jgi:hypothetical protein
MNLYVKIILPKQATFFLNVNTNSLKHKKINELLKFKIRVFITWTLSIGPYELK